MNRQRRWFFWCGLTLLLACAGLLLVLADRRRPAVCAATVCGWGAGPVPWPYQRDVAGGLCCVAPTCRASPVALAGRVAVFLPLYLHAAAWDAGFGQLGLVLPPCAVQVRCRCYAERGR